MEQQIPSVGFQALCFCSAWKGLQLCSLQRAPAHLRKELLRWTDPRRSALPQSHGAPQETSAAAPWKVLQRLPQSWEKAKNALIHGIAPVTHLWVKCTLLMATGLTKFTSAAGWHRTPKGTRMVPQGYEVWSALPAQEGEKS